MRVDSQPASIHPNLGYGVEIDKLYILFDLHPKATLADLKRAYRSKVKENHPDLVRMAAPLRQHHAEERMKEINIAYQKLLGHIKAQAVISARSSGAVQRPQKGQRHTADTSGENATRNKPSSPPHRTHGKRPPRQAPKRKINPENNLITELIRTFWEGLARLNMKAMFTAPPSEEKPPGKKQAPPPRKPEDFHDILDEILKGNENERPFRKQGRKSSPYTQSMRNYGRRTSHRKQHDSNEVGSIKPVSRVRKVHRDD